MEDHFVNVVTACRRIMDLARVGIERGISATKMHIWIHLCQIRVS